VSSASSVGDPDIGKPAVDRASRRPVVKHDGRHARRERGRLAAIDATFELILEGQIPPSAEQVAERANISLSSLFRYFDGLADMQLQALDRFADRYISLLADPSPDAPPADTATRIAEFVKQRIELFDQAGALIVLAQRRAIDNPMIHNRLAALAQRQAGQVRSWFAPELGPIAARDRDTDGLIGVINSVASAQGFQTLTHVNDCTPSDIEQAWRRSIRVLLDQWRTTRD
jgi:AcrR family transcriptional regulator